MTGTARSKGTFVFIRCCRGLIHLTGGLAAGFAIILAVLAWQLSRGPISLGFLTPYIEDALNERQRDFHITLGDTILTWAGWDRALDIRVLEVRALDAHGAKVADIPEVSFSLSGQALVVKGLIAPKSIELFGPRLNISRALDGAFELGVGEDVAGAGAFGGGLIMQLLTNADPDSPMGYLTKVNIIGAETFIEDALLDQSWRSPSADLRLRRDAGGIHGELDLAVEVDGRDAEVAVIGGYTIAEERLDVGISFSHVSPATLAEFHEALEPLKAIELPLKGQVSLGMKIGEAPQAVGFDFTGADGKVNLPEPLAQTVDVTKVMVRGRYDGENKISEITVFELAAASGTELVIPDSHGHAVPFDMLSFSGAYEAAADRLTVRSLKLGLAGPAVEISGTAEQVSGNAKVAINGIVQDINIDDLETYWAPGWAADARSWAVTRLSEGKITNATFAVSGEKSADGGFVLGEIAGEMDLKDLTVDYLSPMPKLRHVDATAKFTDKRADFVVTHAESLGLQINGGRIFLTGLDNGQERADIETEIIGSLPAALKLIDHEPLGYTSGFGVNASDTSGDATVKLNITMPLERGLPLEKVDVNAQAQLIQAAVPGIFAGFDVSNADLVLDITKDGMDVRGTARVADIPAGMSWRENFSDGAPFKTLLDLTGAVADVTKLRELGLTADIFGPRYVNGPVKADARFTVYEGQDTRVEVKADLSNSRLTIDEFHWAKPEGVPAQSEASLTLDIDTGDVREVSSFTLQAAELTASGRAKFDRVSTNVERIDFNQIRFGRSEMAGAMISLGDGSWDIGFQGPTLDLTPIWADIVGGGDGDGELPEMVLALEFQKVWIEDERSMQDVSATFSWAGDHWRTALISGGLDGGGKLDVSLKLGDDGNRTVEARSDDAGTAFKTLGFYDSMVGGKMKVAGVYNDSVAERPLAGRLVVKDYRIIDAPALAHVVSIMALTGILDALEGEGLGFAVLDVPFTTNKRGFVVKDGRASGRSLGFTASGNLLTDNAAIDIKGTIVPAYALNSALGRIPVLGGLFTGGEEGSGIFAANFTMTGPTEKPEISVNPLTALAPGFLRNIFGILDSDKPPPEISESESEVQPTN